MLVMVGLAATTTPAAQALTPPAVCATTPITVTINSSLVAETGIISYQYWPGGDAQVGPGNGCTVTLQQPNGNIATAVGGNNGWKIKGWAGYASATITSYGPANPGPSGLPTCRSLAAIPNLVDGTGGKRPVCSSSVGDTGSTATVTISVTTATVANACTAPLLTVTVVSRESSGAQVWNGSTQTKGDANCYVQVQEPDGRIDSIPGRGWKITGFKGYGTATITAYGPVNPGPAATASPLCKSPAAFGYYTDGSDGKRPVCSSGLGTDTSSASVEITVTPLPTLTVAISSGSGTVTSTPAGINCGTGGALCIAPFETNTSVALTATAASGYVFDHFEGACTGKTCNVTMSSNKSVTAVFAPILATLAVTVAGNGSGSVADDSGNLTCTLLTCQASYAVGSTVTLTATPDEGSTFTGWSGSGSTCEALNPVCSLTLTDSVNATPVTATFEPAVGQSQFTISKLGSGFGLVTSSPAGINCGATCTAPFPASGSVTLTAAPDAGSVFSGWNFGTCGTKLQCIVPATQDRTITATFQTAPVKNLTVVRDGTGTGTVTSSPSGISCGSTCSKNFVQGTVVTLTAAPAADSRFSGWSGACTGTGQCVVTMSTLKTVGATFASLSSGAVVPGAPTKVVGDPRNKAIRVTWSAPSNGGSPITKYTVTASPGGKTCTTSTRACLVTGLVNGTAYKFTVKAKNAVGTGKASAASAPVKAGSPTKPQSLSVSFPAAGVARVAWKAPALVNAGPILSYQVRKSANNGSTWGAWITVKVSALRLTSMRKGTTYLVQVRAVNKAGAGPAAQLKFIQKT